MRCLDVQLISACGGAADGVSQHTMKNGTPQDPGRVHLSPCPLSTEMLICSWGHGTSARPFSPKVIRLTRPYGLFKRIQSSIPSQIQYPTVQIRGGLTRARIETLTAVEEYEDNYVKFSFYIMQNKNNYVQNIQLRKE